MLLGSFLLITEMEHTVFNVQQHLEMNGYAFFSSKPNVIKTHSRRLKIIIIWVPVS